MELHIAAEPLSLLNNENAGAVGYVPGEAKMVREVLDFSLANCLSPATSLLGSLGPLFLVSESNRGKVQVGDKVK